MDEKIEKDVDCKKIGPCLHFKICGHAQINRNTGGMLTVRATLPYDMDVYLRPHENMPVEDVSDFFKYFRHSVTQVMKDYRADWDGKKAPRPRPITDKNRTIPQLGHYRREDRDL